MMAVPHPFPLIESSALVLFCCAGFLLNADLPDALKKTKLVPGSLLDHCSVTKVDKKKKVVSVTCTAKETSVAEEGLTISNLAPGMLVAAKVRTVLPDGLLLSFLTYFTVSAPSSPRV